MARPTGKIIASRVPGQRRGLPLPLPGIDIERLMEAGPEAVAEVLAKKASNALVNLSVALLYQTEFLKREIARLAAGKK
jgi:hypothetical protein